MQSLITNRPLWYAVNIIVFALLFTSGIMPLDNLLVNAVFSLIVIILVTIVLKVISVTIHNLKK